MKRLIKTRVLVGVAAVVTSVGLAVGVGFGNGGAVNHVGTAAAGSVDNSGDTTTPIKHVVVILDENISFDHYFGTYPYAANSDGTTFTPAAGTPGLPGSSETVNTELAAGDLPASVLGTAQTNPNGGAVVPNPNAGGTQLISRDPNAGSSTTSPNDNEYQPQRIPQTASDMCDSNHGYTPEEDAEDNGKMDDFVQYTSGDCTIPGVANSSPGIALNYYDGNSASAMWNWAQNYAMSDNSWDATFGPSFPGYVNAFGATTYSSILNQTLTSNIDTPYDDDSPQGWEMGGNDIGDLLNAAGVTWGTFTDGFSNYTGFGQLLNGHSIVNYVPDFDPGEFWQDTSNPAHTPPASLSEIGFEGPANHNYDADDFNDALAGTGGASLPAVSFLRPTEWQSGHPASSGVLEEQAFLTKEIDAIEQSPDWPSTAIVIEYDDSDGFYDHQSPTSDVYMPDGSAASKAQDIILNSSKTSSDAGVCTNAAAAGVPELGNEDKRCGPSQRLPFVVISPYAKKNYVSHALTTQVSTLQFIEQNWNLPLLGTDTFDNLSQTDNLDDFFDWQHPQQNEVILDQTCQVSGLKVVSNTCNNTTANAQNGDGVTDAGFGAVAATPAVSTPVAAPPVVTVPNTTVSLPLSVKGTLSTSEFLKATGATVDEGTVTADLTSVNAAKAGTYTATVWGVYHAGQDDDISSLQRVTVHVNVLPTINVPNTSLTYEASNPPSPAQILADSGASFSGALDQPNLTGMDLATPGTYQVLITGAANGEQATPVTVTVTVIPDPAITLTNPTVYAQVGQILSPQQVLSDAGASINTGALAPPDLSGVDFAHTGIYTVTISGSAAGFDAAAGTVTVKVISVPAIQVANGVVAYVTGAAPSASEVLNDAGAQISEGALAVDLSAVNFSEPGTYTVQVTGSDNGVTAQAVTLKIQVEQRPVVTIGSSTIDTTAGGVLSSAQILTDADAGVSDNGILDDVDLSGVKFEQPGSYNVTVTGTARGLAATPATVTIQVLPVPSVTVADSQLSYPVNADAGVAEVLSDAGASVSDNGDASVDLSTVNWGAPGTYSVQITGGANGIAATPATVDITVEPDISVKSEAITYPAGADPTPSAVMRAAGATVSAGALATPDLGGVTFSEAGTYKVQVNARAHGVSAAPASITITVKPRLSVRHRRVKIARLTRVTAKLLIKKTGATLRNQHEERLGASFADVKATKAGTYTARIVAIGTNDKVAAAKSVRVEVVRK